MLQNLRDQCEAIEECYEFMLAYAAQGLASDAGSPSGDKLRPLLDKASLAISSLVDDYRAAVDEGKLQPADKHRGFLAVFARDSSDAQAAIDLVLAQQAISSQLIDNLNASIHLRALLTDLFLLDEVMKAHQQSASQPVSTES
jgi:hypothetical protein